MRRCQRRAGRGRDRRDAGAGSCLPDLAGLGLKPHIVETWKLSTGPQFIDKVRDVVGRYMSAPENAL